MNKILIALLLLLALTLMLLLFLSSILTRPTPEEDTEPTPTRVIIQLPTLQPNELAILSHLPKEITETPYLPMQKITLNFSDEVATEDIGIETSPTTPIQLIQGKSKNTIYVVPQTLWTEGKTTVTILTTTTSVSGKKLSYPYVLSITTGLPPTIDPEINAP